MQPPRCTLREGPCPPDGCLAFDSSISSLAKMWGIIHCEMLGIQSAARRISEAVENMYVLEHELQKNDTPSHLEDPARLANYPATYDWQFYEGRWWTLHRGRWWSLRLPIVKVDTSCPSNDQATTTAYSDGLDWVEWPDARLIRRTLRPDKNGVWA